MRMAAHMLCAKEKESRTRMEEISIAVIDTEASYTRTVESDAELEALCDSIRECGLIEPIAVRETPQGYALIAGARRLEACRRLGWRTIPAQVIDACDACEALLLSLCENLHRHALHYLDEAEGYRRAIEEFGLTQEELSRRVGRSQSAIANKLRLLQLRPSEQQAIRRSGHSERHARALLSLETEEVRLRLIALCESQDIPVRRLEMLIAQELTRQKASGERRIMLITHDQRLYINAIRDIVSQMKASGIHADMKMEDLGDRIEMRVILPRQGRGN